MALNEQAASKVPRTRRNRARIAVVAAAEEEQEEEEQGGGDSHKRCALKSKLLGLTDERRALEGAVAANMGLMCVERALAVLATTRESAATLLSCV